MILKCKINVTKIDKSKLFAGKSGTYLDCTLLENRSGTDQYGNDGMIIQDVSKAEREAGTRGAIIGNYKIQGTRQPENPGSRPQSRPTPASAPVAGDSPPEDQEIPF